MTDGPSPDHDRDLLAAEYALGLLSGAELAAAQTLEAADPSFAEKVRQWQAQGADWLAGIEPVTPAPQVWEKLAPMFGEPSVQPPLPTIRRRRNPRRSAAPVPDVSEARKWRSRAYLATAASVALAIALGMSVLTTGFSRSASTADQTIIAQTDQERPASLNLAAAQIVDSEGNTLLTALFDPESRELWVNVADISDGSRSLELWALDDSGKPISLGLVEDSDPKRQVSQNLGDILVSDRIIAVTLEERATAPHVAPTGDILGTARLKLL